MTDQQLQSLRNLGCEFEEAADLICSQAAEIAALRADAERYRWLRSDEVETPGDYEILVYREFRGGRILLLESDLDAAIDAARQQSR